MTQAMFSLKLPYNFIYVKNCLLGIELVNANLTTIFLIVKEELVFQIAGVKVNVPVARASEQRIGPNCTCRS